jgi:predicted metalloprotease with PDZ domain
MVRYHLGWSRPHDRLFDVTVSFAAPVDTPRLLLPAWRPGRYLLQDYAANVRVWGVSHPVWKDGKTSWWVVARAVEEVEVRYRYYAGVLDAGSSFLDDDEAYANGSNLFMLVEGLRHEEHGLVIGAPPGWRIETQMERQGETFIARDYDYLVDSPLIASAAMTKHTFEEGGAAFHLVFRGDEGIETRQFVEPTRAIARTQAALFGGFPFREYRFLFHVADKWHGVEHQDSCSIILKRTALAGSGPGDEGYDHTLSIISHELFHVWNVKRILPARFSPYDYWQETPTRLLWVMEGLTSYYGELSMVRSGVWNEERYVAHLQKEIETLESMPARLHLPLSQASFDGWLANPAHQHDAGNAAYSFYNKGQVVSALLDLTIRRVSGGTRSLDDVLRLMWEEHGRTGRGLEEDGFERLVARVADVGDFFARYVDGVDPLPYDEVLATAGISFASALRGDVPSLAAKLYTQDGMLLVDSVVRGGAGMEAGLLPGDEIVTVEGFRTATEGALLTALRGMASGGELVVVRRGVMKRLRVEARLDPRPQVRLQIVEDSPTRREWLRRTA